MKYKALLVDLDDTLITSSQVYTRALKFASRFLSEKYGLDEKQFFDLVLEKHKIIDLNFPTVHTRHSRILVFRMALDEIKNDFDLGLLPDVEDMYWDYFLKNVEVYPGVKTTLAKLKRAGIKIAIVSDGDLSLRIRKVRYSGLLKYTDEVVASEEVIFEKPFSAIFTLALSRLKIQPHDAIMLGNNYKNDIQGAQLLGIRAGMFAPKEKGNPEGQASDGTIIPDFTIANFSEILKEFEID